MSSDIFYRMFEEYYQKAVRAEEEGRLEEAKHMYLLASEALLKSARETDGETKAALIRRSDKLQCLADKIVLPEKIYAERKATPNLNGGAEGNRNSDENTTIWRSFGKTNVRFEDIAGLYEVKESIQKRVVMPRQHPELYELFHREVGGGILLYGPPGTGKTMVAKAIANEVDADFFSVRCSDIVGKYFGEAEKNVKSLFEAARACDAAVVFFDEFEALASKRGSDSSVMNRLVPELLSQMDGFSEATKNNILVLGATNRPWDLDSAFLRPPRLTEKIYVGLPDYEARLYLMTKAFQGVPCDTQVELGNWARRTDGYNAADIVAFCGFVKDLAIGRSVQSGSTSCIVEGDFTEALQSVHSSVQSQDIDRLRRWEREQKGG